jgi:hypothetical protein
MRSIGRVKLRYKIYILNWVNATRLFRRKKKLNLSVIWEKC